MIERIAKIWNGVPEPLRKQASRMAWVIFGFILIIQAISFIKTNEFYDFELRKLFGL